MWLTLLQSATALFITKCDSYFIAKCDWGYYKVWLRLLQSATGITKCDDYYKVSCLLMLVRARSLTHSCCHDIRLRPLIIIFGPLLGFVDALFALGIRGQLVGLVLVDRFPTEFRLIGNANEFYPVLNECYTFKASFALSTWLWPSDSNADSNFSSTLTPSWNCCWFPGFFSVLASIFRGSLGRASGVSDGARVLLNSSNRSSTALIRVRDTEVKDWLIIACTTVGSIPLTPAQSSGRSDIEL